MRMISLILYVGRVRSHNWYFYRQPSLDTTFREGGIDVVGLCVNRGPSSSAYGFHCFLDNNHLILNERVASRLHIYSKTLCTPACWLPHGRN
jgi:hypothetical protein